jgi:hypothetical protein
MTVVGCFRAAGGQLPPVTAVTTVTCPSAALEEFLYTSLPLLSSVGAPKSRQFSRKR